MTKFTKTLLATMNASQQARFGNDRIFSVIPMEDI